MPCAIALAVALTWPQARAAAQEAAPIPLRLAIAPDGSLAAVAVRDKGLVMRDDSQHWRMLCAGALDLSASSLHHETAWASGEILLATFRGLRLTDATGCNARPHDTEDLPERNVFAIDRVADTLYALSSLDGDYTLYVGEDLGADFAPQADLGKYIYLGLRVAPSRPERIYFYGIDWDGDSGVSTRLLFRSDDGGASRQGFELDLEEDERSFALLAVDPDDPDRLYASLAMRTSSHMHAGEMHMAELDQLLVSDDGGETFRMLHEVPAFGGFALGDEPGELWLGNAEGGLLRSTDYGENFAQVDDSLHLSCVQRVGDRLWVCADSTVDPFSVGYTEDDGETFQPVMRLADVAGPLVCGGQLLSECQRTFDSFRFWHPAPMPGVGDAGAGDAGATTDGPASNDPADDPADDPSDDPSGGQQMDAGASPDGGFNAGKDDDDGCGCATPGAPTDGRGAGLPLGLAVAAVWVWARRRADQAQRSPRA